MDSICLCSTALVLNKTDGYVGRPSVPISGEHLIPILPRTQQWNHNGRICSRRQIPLASAFAIIIHKSQGLTLDKAVVNLDTKRIVSNLTYVALSRVRHPNSLALKGIALFDRFPNDISVSVKLQQNDARRLLGQPVCWIIDGCTKASCREGPTADELQEVEEAMDALTAESLID